MAEQFQLTLVVESHMASLNDNLFTTFSSYHGMLTRLGWVQVRFSVHGLTDLVFKDGKSPLDMGDLVFREAFLDWVSDFERLDVEAKWGRLDLQGTDFQKSVWRELLEIPYGSYTSYGQIAAELGRPRASRAVGSAVGANPVSLLVPCHRVLPSTGGSGNYRWGADRKRALLDLEQESGSDLCSLFQ